MPRPYGPLMDIEEYRSVSSLRYFTAQTPSKSQTLQHELLKFRPKSSIVLGDPSGKQIRGKRIMEERTSPAALAVSLPTLTSFGACQDASGLRRFVLWHFTPVARDPRPSFPISPWHTVASHKERQALGLFLPRTAQFSVSLPRFPS